MLVTSDHRDALNHRLAPIIHGVWVLGGCLTRECPSDLRLWVVKQNIRIVSGGHPRGEG